MQSRVVLPSSSSSALPGALDTDLALGRFAAASPAAALPVRAVGQAPAEPRGFPAADTLVAPRVQLWLLGVLFALNAVDALMTLLAVRLGVATEANPIMAAALEVGEPMFLASKMIIVGLGCLVLWLARRRRIAQIGACVCVAAYSAIALVHVWTGVLISRALG